jgi:hypothetical protein
MAHEGNPVLRLLTIAPSGGGLNRQTTCCIEVLTMDFSLIDYLDEDARSTKLVELLHPDGLAYPRRGERQRLEIHRCHRAPLVDFQCGTRGRVVNAFTGSSLQGTDRRPSQLLTLFHKTIGLLRHGWIFLPPPIRIDGARGPISIGA